MNTTIALLLAQDGLTNGVIYALLAVAILLVFLVTRILLVPQGEFVVLGAVTLAQLQRGQFADALWLLAALRGAQTSSRGHGVEERELAKLALADRVLSRRPRDRRNARLLLRLRSARPADPRGAVHRRPDGSDALLDRVSRHRALLDPDIAVRRGRGTLRAAG